MDWTITIGPTHEPVSLEQAKRHLRLDGTNDTASDQIIRSYISAARRYCEGIANRAFLWQTITVRMDNFQDEVILPRGPLVAVTSYKYIDTASTEQTLASTIYDVDSTHEPGRVVLAYNQTWPTCRGHHHDVRIACIVGHAKSCTRSSNTLVIAGHLATKDDPVQVYNVGGALPAGLAANTQYYVLTVAGNSITVATSENGATVAMSDAGTGTHYVDTLPQNLRDAVLMKVTDLYANRGDVEGSESRAIVDLLSIDRMVSL